MTTVGEKIRDQRTAERTLRLSGQASLSADEALKALNRAYRMFESLPVHKLTELEWAEVHFYVDKIEQRYDRARGVK